MPGLEADPSTGPLDAVLSLDTTDAILKPFHLRPGTDRLDFQQLDVA